MQDSSHPCPVRPWPIPNADRSPKNISEYIELVNRTYPGGFRALNVDKIREGLEDGDELANTKMGDGEDGGEAEDASATKDPIEARNETLFNVVYVPGLCGVARPPTDASLQYCSQQRSVRPRSRLLAPHEGESNRGRPHVATRPPRPRRYRDASLTEARGIQRHEGQAERVR